jgi:hypothetical protein
MLIPIFLIFAIACLALLTYSILKRSLVLFVILNIACWLSSAVSGYFIWLAFKDRAYSENWALIGVLFFSFPAIIIVLVMAVSSLLAIKIKKMTDMGPLLVSIYLLLAFLLVQVATGIFSGLH